MIQCAPTEKRHRFSTLVGSKYGWALAVNLTGFNLRKLAKILVIFINIHKWLSWFRIADRANYKPARRKTSVIKTDPKNTITL